MFRRKKEISWGNLRRLRPISDAYGLDRGQAIDRYYIESFLKKYKNDVQGRVLEVLDSRYTLKYGGTKVVQSDILDIDANNKKATVIADLAQAEAIAADSYDCFILTQTLQYIYDLKAALFHVQRVLKPGAVVLATFPAVSRIDCVAGVKGDYWRFTEASARRLFSELFAEENIAIEVYGNVLVAVSFLMGLAALELKKEELDCFDPNFPVLISVRAVKQKS